MSAKGTFQSGILDLSAVIPKLPKVRFPSGTEVQLQHFSAEGYEKFRRLRRMYSETIQGNDDQVEDLVDAVDELLQMVLPGATTDDLASLGYRMEARMAPIFAVAGEVDVVLAVLMAASEQEEAKEDSEGKPTAG